MFRKCSFAFFDLSRAFHRGASVLDAGLCTLASSPVPTRAFSLCCIILQTCNIMVPTRVLLTALLLFASGPGHMIAGFTLVARPSSLARTTTKMKTTGHRRSSPALFEKKQELDDGVVELVDSSTEEQSTKKEGGAAVPNNPLFISQGEIDPETLNPDLSDPKQARVIIYIIISLIPVLFLIPLMLGSRELIPLDAVPPVQM